MRAALIQDAVAGRDDPPQILEWLDPSLVVLTVVGLIAGAGQDLLGHCRVLVETRPPTDSGTVPAPRSPPLSG